MASLGRHAKAPLCAVFLVTLVLALFWELQVSTPNRRNLAGLDLELYYYPTYDVAYDWISKGELPLWNPYQLLGVPWHATLQGGFLYPPHLLYVFLPTHLALALSGMLHLVLVGAATAVFARRISLPWSASLFAGLLIALRGRYPAMLLFPNMLEAAAWLPVGAIAVLDLFRDSRLRGFVLLALSTTASLLAGYPQVTLYTGYAWGVLALAAGMHARRPPAEFLKRASASLAALLIGVLLAAVQLWPTYELQSMGVRSVETLTTTQASPFSPAPGDGIIQALRFALTGHPYYRTSTPELVASFGFVGLLLAPIAGFNRSRRWISVALALLAAVTLVFSIGRASGLFELFRVLPLISVFRIPARVLFVTDFCFAILCAIGLHETARRLGRPTSAGSRVVWAWLLVGGGFWCGASASSKDPAGVLAGVSLCILALSAMTGFAKSHTRLAGLVLLLAVGEILLARSNLSALPYRADAMEEYHHRHAGYEPAAAGTQRTWRWWDLGSLTPKFASRHGLRSVVDYEPLATDRQATYFEFLRSGTTDPERAGFFTGATVGQVTNKKHVDALRERRRLLDLAAVRYYLVPGRIGRAHPFRKYLDSAGFRRLPASDSQLSIYENPNALPRAYVAYGVESAPADSATLLERLSQASFDPLEVTFVEGDHDLPPPEPSLRGHEIDVVLDEPTAVELEADLERPGLVVLADAHFPGWQATVDGVAAEIRIANHLFRGVVVPPGRHRVRFDFRPRSLEWGAYASAFGLLSLVGVVCAVLLARKRR